jgi:peptide/nickel transport system permease protein
MSTTWLEIQLQRPALSRTRRLPPTLLAGAAILTVYLVVALTGRFWAPYGPTQIGIGRPFAKPAPEHLLGADRTGRDVFSRVIHGADKVLALSLSSTLIATALGGLLGLASGLLGGWFDSILMRLIEVLISIPLLIFALLVIAIFGQRADNLTLLVGVVAFVYTPRIARMARAVSVGLVTQDYVTVARARGESTLAIVWHELLPNATGVLLVEFGVRAGQAPLLIGALGFLGLGAQPPTPEWGAMISENRAGLISSPVVVLAPALALAGLVIGLNLFTDGLARLLGRTAQHSPQ